MSRAASVVVVLCVLPSVAFAEPASVEQVVDAESIPVPAPKPEKAEPERRDWSVVAQGMILAPAGVDSSKMVGVQVAKDVSPHVGLNGSLTPIHAEAGLSLYFTDRDTALRPYLASRIQLALFTYPFPTLGAGLEVKLPGGLITRAELEGGVFSSASVGVGTTF